MKIITIAFATALSGALLASAAAPAEAHRGYDNRRIERPEPWRDLATVRATGADDAITVDRRAGRIDELRLEASRGVVDLRSVVFTFADGRQYTAAVNERLRPGAPHVVQIPGPARRVARVDLVYAGHRFWTPRSFLASRAQLAIHAR